MMFLKSTNQFQINHECENLKRDFQKHEVVNEKSQLVFHKQKVK
jgi:hypothetical protein